MIQLANDPNASRSFQRNAASAEPKTASGEPRARNGHSWPFISRYAARPAREGSADKPAAQHGGS